MQRNLYKQTSFDVESSGDQGSQRYDEYVSNLRSNNQMIEMALKTAQSLIDEYQRQNHQLKQKNKTLQKQINEKDQQIEYLKQLMMDQQYQQSIQKKVKDLMERNIQAQQKVTYLTYQLEKCNKKIAQIKKQKHKNVEKTLKNYFNFSQSLNENALNQQHESLAKQNRSLKWKLEQRQDEINMLLRRNKTLEQRQRQNRTYKKIEKQQYPTCPTQQSKSRYPRQF